MPECSLKYHFHHGVGAERAVQLVKLFAAGGANGQGQAQVLASTAGALCHAVVAPSWVEMAHDHQHGLNKTFYLLAHDFDGEITGVRNQAVVGGCRHKKGL